MEILVEAHERFDEVLEDNFDAKHMATQKFETWERVKGTPSFELNAESKERSGGT